MHSFGVRAALSDKSRAFSSGDIPGFSSAVCLYKWTARQCNKVAGWPNSGCTCLVGLWDWTQRALGLGLESQVILSLALYLNVVGFYSLTPVSESSSEERKCYSAVIISNVYCLNESGLKLKQTVGESQS